MIINIICRRFNNPQGVFMSLKSVVRHWGMAMALGLTVLPAYASERHFGFSYESPVLQDGSRELETYTTYRFGRDHFFSGLNENIEFELGLGGGVQTSLYLSFDQTLEENSAGAVNSSLIFDGLFHEWK